MNPFDYLGIPRDAGLQDAKAAYRRLAKACHPDRHRDDPDAAAKFALLHAAYTDAMKIIAGGPADHRQANPSEGAKKAPSYRTVWREIEIDVAFAMSGGEVVIPGACGLCAHCSGEGRISVGHETECVTCAGTGTSGTRYGAYVSVSIQCHECEGIGRTTYVPCHWCGGFGVSETAECRVTLAPNLRDGDTFVVEGAAAIPSDNVKGDVQVIVKVVDRRYRVVGDDIETNLFLDVWDAAKGGSIVVARPDGSRIKLKYPAGTANGRRFVMSGGGMAMLETEGSGDFVAVATIRPINNLTPEIDRALDALRLAVTDERAAKSRK